MYLAGLILTGIGLGLLMRYGTSFNSEPPRNPKIGRVGSVLIVIGIGLQAWKHYIA